MLADPNHYSDTDLVMETVERKKRLEQQISELTVEWEETFRRLEHIKAEYEEEKASLGV